MDHSIINYTESQTILLFNKLLFQFQGKDV